MESFIFTKENTLFLRYILCLLKKSYNKILTEEQFIRHSLLVKTFQSQLCQKKMSASIAASQFLVAQKQIFYGKFLGIQL